MENQLNLVEVQEALKAIGDNPVLAKYRADLEAMLPGLEAEAAKERAKVAFGEKVAKGRIPPASEWPFDVYNVYLAKETIEDTSKPLEEVEVDGVKVKRHPLVAGIVPTINKAIVVKGASACRSEAGKGPSARSITLTLEGRLIGNFPNGELACKALGLNTGGDSANRVLREARGGNPHYFTVKPYDGAEFTSEAAAKANLAKAG